MVGYFELNERREAGPTTISSLPKKGALRELPSILSSMGRSPIFIVGSGSFNDSGAAACIARDFGSNALLFRVQASLPGFPNDEIARLISVRREESCIVAIGGGNVIDTAKILSLCIDDGTTFSRRLMEGDEFTRKIPLIAVPTTAGSGSEATPFAVAYHDARKYSIDHWTIKPDAVLLDPALIMSTPGSSAAASGLDVIAQSIESLLCKQTNTISAAYAVEALQLAFGALPEFLNRRTGGSASTLMRAANLAGMAIAITRTSAPHALSYAFSVKYGIGHGHAVALSVGGYIDCFIRHLRNDPQKYDFWRSRVDAITDVFGEGNAAGIRGKWRRYVEGTGLSGSLRGCGISSNAAGRLVAAANPQRLGNCPITLSARQRLMLFEAE